jgi:hypothetical protein
MASSFAGVAIWATIAAAEQPEVLLGVSTDFDKGEITFDVIASGCTKKDDFRFDYRNYVLTVIRLRPDACKAMPEKIGIAFQLQEVGIDRHTPFTISNPFIVNHHLAQLRRPRP